MKAVPMIEAGVVAVAVAVADAGAATALLRAMPKTASWLRPLHKLRAVMKARNGPLNPVPATAGGAVAVAAVGGRMAILLRSSRIAIR